jgi:hypothetical protein
MKTKAFLLLCLFIGIGMTQLAAQKSNYVSGAVVFDSYIVTLRPDITMDQYLDFLKTKYVPEYDKYFPGSKMIIASPDSWKKENQYGSFIYFEKPEVYDKYYPNGKEMSAECKAAWEKVQLAKQEENKFILDSKRVEVEWEKWMGELIDK